MNNLQASIEQLDAEISRLEESIGLDAASRREARMRHSENLRTARAREAGVLEVAQKVASRLDWTIERVEKLLKN